MESKRWFYAKMELLMVTEEELLMVTEDEIEAEKNWTIDELRDKWPVLTHADLLQPPKPPNYLVDGLIRQPSVICFYGPPGGLKTMLLLDLYVCIATGEPWLTPSPLLVGGGESYQVKQGPVFILDQENGIDRLRERIGALCRGRGVSPVPIYGLSLPNPPFNANNLKHTDFLADQIKEVGAIFCIVDSLSAVSGDTEENTSKMAQIMRNLRLVSESCGATLAIIHHPRKGTSTETGGREGDRLRGHGSIEASLDLAVYVDRKDDTLILKTTKTRDNPWPQLQIEWSYELDENKALLRCWLWSNGIVEPGASKYAAQVEQLPEILKGMEKPPSKHTLCQEIEKVFGVSEYDGRKIIKEGVKQGIIIEESTGTSKTSPKRYKFPSC
jgi:RecA-family ATPase